jgi:hypothetical protein
MRSPTRRWSLVNLRNQRLNRTSFGRVQSPARAGWSARYKMAVGWSDLLDRPKPTQLSHRQGGIRQIAEEGVRRRSASGRAVSDGNSTVAVRDPARGNQAPGTLGKAKRPASTRDVGIHDSSARNASNYLKKILDLLYTSLLACRPI